MMERIDENGKWIIQKGAEMLIEPSEKWLLENQPTKTEEQLLEDLIQQYKLRVQELINKKYSYSDELAIIRKYTAGIDTKNEFEVYNEYVEQCKAQAKEELRLL